MLSDGTLHTAGFDVNKPIFHLQHATLVLQNNKIYPSNSMQESTGDRVSENLTTNLGKI